MIHGWYPRETIVSAMHGDHLAHCDIQSDKTRCAIRSHTEGEITPNQVTKNPQCASRNNNGGNAIEETLRSWFWRIYHWVIRIWICNRYIYRNGLEDGGVLIFLCCSRGVVRDEKCFTFEKHDGGREDILGFGANGLEAFLTGLHWCRRW